VYRSFRVLLVVSPICLVGVSLADVSVCVPTVYVQAIKNSQTSAVYVHVPSEMGRKKPRFEITLEPSDREIGDELVKHHGEESFSALVRKLLRDEKERLSGDVPNRDLVARLRAMLDENKPTEATPSEAKIRRKRERSS
jgi:predicted CopG family antitoxin